jgi:alkanesulfonate monooxygenase SsuD/methylene tetrahydromethanopterin reductase-like flavin-dependent oxidoreductase (luciferase family)
LGRAPGTDGLTAQALGRNPAIINEQFPRQILELQRYFSKENSDAMVRAIPGEGLDIPLYILGSSTDSAWLAAELGFLMLLQGILLRSRWKWLLKFTENILNLHNIRINLISLPV